METACLREGIGHSTFREWMRRGQKGEEPFAEFVMATEMAMANVETHVTAGILKTSRNQWQAGAWWLKWKANRGRDHLSVTVAPGESRAGASAQLTPDGAAAIRTQILFGDRKLAATNPQPVEAELVEPDAQDFGTEPGEP